MSFRKRNVGLSDTSKAHKQAASTTFSLSGVRPSPLDGRPTTSTGTTTLDSLLAGHSGLPLGSLLLIEENGTTDYAGALLRFYAAEGLLQSHHVHVVGLPEQWGRELPGAVNESDKESSSGAGDKMKIAWRYEHLGQFGSATQSREHPTPRTEFPSSGPPGSDLPKVYCHTFDLTKRLIHPSTSKLEFLNLGMNPTQSPFVGIMETLKSSLANSSLEIVHRVVLPALMSPTLYPPHSCSPQHILGFMHGLRALLSAYSGRMTIIASLPLALYPRSSGMVHWIEILSDGVLELAPFPHSAAVDTPGVKGPSGSVEEPPQGLLRIHKLPVLHERGSGNSASDDDWTFALSRRKLTIKPFNLPPVEGDIEAQQAAGAPQQKAKGTNLEF